MLKEGWKNGIRFKNDILKFAEAEKELMKIRFSEYENLDDGDKIFVSYCLAFYLRNSENKEMARKHIRDVGYIYENKKNVECYRVEYFKYLWLNVNLNYKSMDMKTVIDDMFKVYKYYESVNEKDRASAALANIFGFKRDGEGILYSLEELLKCRDDGDLRCIDSILVDCENLDHNLYIKATQLVKRYLPEFKLEAI